jgi:hypothetical protein
MTTTLAAYAVSQVVTDYRATAATYVDSSGNLDDAGPNALLLDYNYTTLLVNGYTAREGRTNLIRNPRGVGAVAGTPSTPGSPGTLPTDWATSGSAVSFIVIGSGIQNGRDYVDIQIYATAAASAGPVLIYFDNTGIVPALNTNYAYDVGFELVGGSMAGITSFQPEMNQVSSGAAILVSTTGPAVTPNNTYQRIPSITAEVTNASAATLRCGFSIALTSGAPINATIRFFLPQCQIGTFVSSLIRPPAGTVASTTRGADDIRLSLQPAWLDPATNTFVVEVTIPQAAPAGQDQGLFRLDDGTDNNKFVITNVGGTLNVAAELTIGGTLVASVTLGQFIAGTTFRAIAGYSMVSSGLVAGLTSGGNYASAVADVSSAPTFTRALVGRASLNAGTPAANSATHLNGYISELMFCSGAVLDQDAMLYMSQMNQSVGALVSAAGVVLG